MCKIIFTKNAELEYPESFRNLIEKIINESNNTKCDIDFHILHPTDLNDYISLNRMLSGCFKNAIISRKGKDLSKYKNPTIFICNDIDITKLEDYLSLNLDNRIKFFDSSIRFHYINITSIDDFIHKLKDKIGIIEKYYELNSIYSTNVCLEFIEFQARLFINSFLSKLEGAHSTDVTPFKFQSESQMKTMAEDVLSFFPVKKNGEQAFKWRILLVDDYAKLGLKIGDKNNGPTKKKILEKVLSDDKDEKYDWIEIETCESVAKFVELYSEKHNIHDIILFDYLLDKSYQKTHREYSTDILKWIKGDLIFYKIANKIKFCSKNEFNNFSDEGKKEITENKIIVKEELKGPLNKFWFFPISVFSFAFMEDIRQLGYTQLEKEWIIARGADPVNTPELFRYSLFKLMEAQVNRVYRTSVFDSKESDKKYNADLLIGFIKKYFSNSGSVQKIAKEKYHTFLNLYSTFKELEENKKNNSKFAENILESQLISENNSELFEHFQHLIYMLAYEPAYEWSKMWDEFIILKQRVKESLLQSESDLEFLKGIEKYIISLQKQVSSV